MAYPLIDIDPTLVNDATPTHTPGRVYDCGDGSLYRYGKFKDAVTYASGQALRAAATDKTEFTNDVSGGSSLGAIPIGSAIRVHTQNYYGFAKVSGPITMKTNGDDDIAAGDAIILGGTDGTVNSGTGNPSLGVALAADDDTADTVLVDLRGLI